jgi:cytochrome c oxidase subunit 2|tara:strand:+ start:10648 stop:11751 length:1104 start_codon:yes stop_codon:yes gene_type:complete
MRFNKIPRTAAFLSLALLTLLLTGCYPDHNQSTFDPRGPVASEQLEVFWWILVGGFIVFLLVEAALIYAIFKFKVKNESDIPVQTHGNHTLEIIWTAIPTVLLIILMVPTIQTLFYMYEAPKTTLPEHTLEAIGHQWWFEFRYPDPTNSEKEIITANEVYIPVGYPVAINLESVDVIHSFWVPKLAGKTDMVPSEGNFMWFQADEPGEYYGQCAEYCGTSHANMKFKVIAVPEPDFKSWLQAQSNPALESSDPLVQEGAGVFKSAGCTGCHSIKTIVNKGSKGRVGPNLAHVGSRRDLAAGMLRNSDENGSVNDALLQKNLRTWLENPAEVKPGNLMSSGAQVYTNPDKKLTEEQISQLVHYLSSLK